MDKNTAYALKAAASTQKQAAINQMKTAKANAKADAEKKKS